MGPKGKAKASTQKRKPEEEEEITEKKEQPAKKRGKQAEEKEQKKAEQKKAEQDKAEPEESNEEEEQASDSEDSDEGEEESSDEANPDYEQFMQQLKAREEELGKHCVVLGVLEESEDEDEDEEAEEDEDEKAPTLEKLQALARVYVPKQFEKYFEEVVEKLGKIGTTPPGSDDDDEDGMQLPPELAALGIRMLSTRHSYPMQQILQEQLKQVDKAMKKKDWPDAFCRWAATLVAGRRENHWYGDTDQPKEAQLIYYSLRKHWLKLKEHSDEELGGLVAEGCESAKGEFEAFLQGMADEMKEVGIGAE